MGPPNASPFTYMHVRAKLLEYGWYVIYQHSFFKLYKGTLLQPHKINSSYFSEKQYIFRPQDRPLLTPIYYPSDATSFWYDVSRCVVYRRNDGLLTSWNAIDTCAKIVMDPLSEFIWEPVNCSTRLPFMCNKGHNIRKTMNPTFII